jgi:hypothetical protein
MIGWKPLVKWLISSGFIRPDSLGGAEIFCHAKDMSLCYQGQPSSGLQLAFDVIAGRGGRDKAINLELVP